LGRLLRSSRQACRVFRQEIRSELRLPRLHPARQLREKFVRSDRAEKDHFAKQFSYLLDSLLALRVRPL